MDEQKLQTTMEIIINAGDARVKCKQALDAIAVSDFVLAKENLKEAQEKITVAHRAQTDAIQKESAEETADYSILFAHAQDTLMTINSEIILAKQMIKIFENYDKRITALEK
ncbi:PTS lactose/cellobiose transporter subunit IIA [Clostridium oryzae]|uniref:Lactose-specific phosphotransferase enzyme IIA component n=1 Tax=Clostridium oryzae TaxID=1450648 RepID=A0A1V4ISY3_9CLOT|nr:PTS lactose/cellobiose transporter subunit IIA [Clostridium oryzae]OPJ62577.1 lactose-specific phosphotransferase enzyme IIA component [Clostridium oryzae]